MRFTALAGPKKLLVVAVVLVFSVVLLAGCGGETNTQQSTTTVTPGGETTKANQETTTSSSDLAARLVGTWEATNSQGTSLPPGTTMTLTFSADGTLQVATNGGSQNTNTTQKYIVLDDSHIQMGPDEETQVWEYSLSGDTLTLAAPGGVATTYQRTG